MANPPKTIIDMFQNSVKIFSKNPCLGTRKDENSPYEFMTYEEVGTKVSSVAASLKKMGIKKGERVAILSENRPEWSIFDLASLSIGAVDVPLYSSLRPEEMAHILHDSGARLVLVSDMQNFRKIDQIRESLPRLEAIISMSGSTRGMPWKELLGEEELGYTDVKEDDLATLIYTSGTTGMPKGVMLTHENIMATVNGATQVFNILKSDRTISYLPLGHSFERACGYYVLLRQGASIAYARSVETLVEDIKEAKPTVLLGVPRIFEKIHDGIKKKVNEESRLKKFLFNMAIRASENDSFLFPLLDKIVLSKVREGFGGKLKFALSGAAALNPVHADFMEAIGIPVFEAYGMTEAAPGITTNRPGRSMRGTVGMPLPGVEVKLIDVPELDYYSSRNKGEICVKGPNIMKGYFNNEEETKKAVDDEGWLHTGDIGELDTWGYLRIIDRKGSVIKLSQGEKVAQEPLETKLKNSQYISQLMTYGDSSKRELVALIVPDFAQLEQYARDNGISYKYLTDLTESPEVRRLFMSELEIRSASLQGFEKVRNFKLIPEEFTQENGLLTPTLKMKRKKIKQRYEKEIEALYK